MIDVVYDLESYPNIFTFKCRFKGSKNQFTFEVSDRKNQMYELVRFLYYLRDIKARMIGYNNKGYDYPLLHFILTNYQHGLDHSHMYNENMRLINTDWNNRFDNIIAPFNTMIIQIDLMKIHHFDNVAKLTTLKKIEFVMRSHNIEDLPFPVGTILDDQQKDVLIKYNAHDVNETYKFHDITLNMIKFREELSEKYGRDFLNDDDTKIGKNYFIMRLEEALPGACYHMVNGKKEKRQTWRDFINIGEVIFPYIQFEHPEFIRIHNWLNAQTITETKGVFKGLTCFVNNFEFVFGLGGLHACIKPEIVRADDDYAIIDLDVASYYPNIVIANRLFPEHLSETFCDIYLDVYNQRKSYPKGSPENDMLKLALNGIFGNSNSTYTPFYDPKCAMAITVNGQLLLCMLAEQLMKTPSLRMLQGNTDGVSFKVLREYIPHVEAIAKWWEDLTNLELESVEYKAMYIRDVNNYIGEYTDGKLKRKGAYAHNRDDIRELPYHKDHGNLVSRKAAEAYLVRGEDIREFITSHKDVFDFMMCTKVPRTGHLVIEGEVVGEPARYLQNTTRYYVSSTGGTLIKLLKPNKTALAKNPDAGFSRNNLCKGWVCKPCNNMDDAHDFFDKVNYEYYITEAEKLTKVMKNDN